MALGIVGIGIGRKTEFALTRPGSAATVTGTYKKSHGRRGEFGEKKKRK